MPDRSRGVFRRRRQRPGVLVAGWARRTSHRSPWSHQVCSLVTAALLVLATAVATLAVGPMSASAALNPVATADAINGLPDVTIHMTTALMSNGIHTRVTQTASCPIGTVEVGGGGYLGNATNPATVPNNGLVLGGSNPSTGANGAPTPRNWMAIANFTGRRRRSPMLIRPRPLLCARPTVRPTSWSRRPPPGPTPSSSPVRPL